MGKKQPPSSQKKKKKTLPNSSLPVSSRCQTPGATRWRRRRRRPRAARRGRPPPPLPLHLPPPPPPLSVLLLRRSSCAPVLQETLGASARGPQLRVPSSFAPAAQLRSWMWRLLAPPPRVLQRRRRRRVIPSSLLSLCAQAQSPDVIC
ncbi:hypothetical protein SORBI_3005G001800 [Sorghum bicolor]|uniref:Uncharacterized protein n=1 Tax=Sorghum bicolor TaxID=4558 RepID=A0A1B6PPE5_SORBI|nr:hypothetical protein SORBI_3005G001800 [Sorghum bicolor]